MLRRGVALTVLFAAPSVARAGNAAIYVPAEIWAAEDRVSDAGTTDGDTNDVVVEHASRCVLSPGGELLSQTIHLEAIAGGADLTNRLELKPEFPATALTIRRGVAAPVTLTPDGQGWYTLYADFDDAFVGSPDGFVNTEEGSPVPGVPAVIEVTYAPGTFEHRCAAPHFAIARSGVRIDQDSVLPSNEQPLAIRLPSGWAVPVEKVRIEAAYLRFLDWVESVVAGCEPGVDCLDEDWADDPIPAHTIERPDLVAEPLAPLPSCADGVQNGDETFEDCGGSVCGSCYLDCDGDPVDVSGLVVVEFAGDLTGVQSYGTPTGIFAVPEVIGGWYAYDPTWSGTDMSAFYLNQPVWRYQAPARAVVRHGPSGGPLACQDGFSAGYMQLEDRPAGAGAGSDRYYVEASAPGNWALQIDFLDYEADAGIGTALPESAPAPFDGQARVYLTRTGPPNQDRAYGPVTKHRCATCRTAFTTSASWQGNLGGLAGADAKCQAAADAAGLDGTFLAWLSTVDGPAPAARFTRSTVPYVRTDGARIAADWYALVDGALDVPIDRNESGTALPNTWPGYHVWTNTTVAGEAAASDCQGWTTSSTLVNGKDGAYVGVDTTWTETATHACINSYHLYCFEQ